ncbi:phytanoyl-CoA dioxygenase family protein [Vibrio coralliilyticus]|uniref:phytanoyl-CoA dioxygenase family protein n=1 Tax=Vibrio coralliilyticus TaxID=190893 RepID=UPI000C16FA48|nr:phytanoyl-CoA dioxygenase family protein [Vibrio coralliilyticus]NRF13942.1 phytanoyl-CoA dioxygenase family protein [Vibrio coralliilyticus]NRF62152.1 phytanoyl-CoA dioxygenase family protein [Vibrio coralliilyticus]
MSKDYPLFADASQLSLEAFIESCKPNQQQRYQHTEDDDQGIAIYHSSTITADNWQQIKEEMAHVFLQGSGIVVIKGFYSDLHVVDKMSRIFDTILESERGFGEGDHFAQTGAKANGRIWNAFQKSANIDPQAFVDYYKNPLLNLVSEAWLGAHYQVTAQVNIVRPGGRAQQSHRDYHLGFQHADSITQYPLHAQKMSTMLTLQGAVAHSDMPLESGPTKLLPYSQHYPLGYLSCREDAFKAHFEQRYVQLPLAKGDALFFNPAVIHAAGQNDTDDHDRCANLLQISSVFGKPMESIDLNKISRLVYEPLAKQWQGDHLTPLEKEAILTASADGYSFPTNLDTDSPIGELAPQTMKQLLKEALDNRWNKSDYENALQALLTRRQPEPRL